MGLGPQTLPVPSSHVGPHSFVTSRRSSGYRRGSRHDADRDGKRTLGPVLTQSAPGSRPGGSCHVRGERGEGRAASFTVRKERRGGVDAWSIRLGGPATGQRQLDRCTIQTYRPNYQRLKTRPLVGRIGSRRRLSSGRSGGEPRTATIASPVAVCRWFAETVLRPTGTDCRAPVSVLLGR